MADQPRPIRSNVALVAILLLTGCASPAPSEPAPTDATDWGPLTVARLSGNGDKARTEGTLQFDAGCVFLVGGNKRTLLAWPNQRTSWDGQTSSILYVHSDRTVARLFNGQHWAVGGSGDRFADVVQRLDWVVPPPSECAVEEIWIVGEVIED